MNILLFDIDGVLLFHTRKFVDYFLQKYQFADKDLFLQFHQGVIGDECERGLKDPVKEVGRCLTEAKIPLSVSEYFTMQQQFEEDGIDYQLLDMISKIDRHEYVCCIASNQNYYRKAYLIKKMRLDTVFEKLYFSTDIKHIKPEREYWEYVFADLKKTYNQLCKDEVCFFDDREENIESAKKFGFNVQLINSRQEIAAAVSRFPHEQK